MLVLHQYSDKDLSKESVDVLSQAFVQLVETHPGLHARYQFLILEVEPLQRVVMSRLISKPSLAPLLVSASFFKVGQVSTPAVTKAALIAWRAFATARLQSMSCCDRTHRSSSWFFA